MRVETLKSGERVIVDPAMTTQRMFLYFYFFINIGSIVGQISMVYAERYGKLLRRFVPDRRSCNISLGATSLGY